ncbi:hypothetical protein [Corynebacterium glaucum]|uniref:hypothetical protein n=1 Tax=Corynebacterium glaucum TaxID=187491 RepID=UPI0025B30AC0|nr:hypothetical protein [Corynebacterium glaucum]WJZ08367.1 hypothetical protein CGLAUT_09460 [Corynebacterium glaucum]
MTEILLTGVPDDLLRRLEDRARKSNLTISDVIIRELAGRETKLPTDEALAQLAALEPVLDEDETIAESVRAERDSR